jgi:hypothetical protein
VRTLTQTAVPSKKLRSRKMLENSKVGVVTLAEYEAMVGEVRATDSLSTSSPGCGCSGTDLSRQMMGGHFIGRDHGIASLGEHREDVSKFNDLLQHRLAADPMPQSGSGQSATGSGCATMTTRQSRTRERGAAHRECETESAASREYDWNAFLPLLDETREVVSVEDDERRGSRRRLKIVDGLVTVKANGPFGSSGNLGIGTHGPGGLPLPPLDVKKSRPSLAGGTTVKAPKGPLLPNMGDFKPIPIPQAAQSTEYTCPGLTWHSGAAYRRYTVGKGQCSGDKGDSDFWDGQSGEKAVIHDSFFWAYQVLRAAELEMEQWIDLPVDDKKRFWVTFRRFPEATLETWLGDVDGEDFEGRFKFVYATLAAWSYRFRHGFYSWAHTFSVDLEVLLSCRPELDGRADHTLLNVIRLKDDFFNDGITTPVKTGQIQTMLHEMGHWARVDFYPFLHSWGMQGIVNLVQDYGLPNDDLDDRQDPMCMGWNDNKCYCGRTNDAWEGIASPFIGSNAFVILDGTTPLLGAAPFALVAQANGGSKSARNRMLSNIDNFVGYLWNRWLDHGYCNLDLPQDQ